MPTYEIEYKSEIITLTRTVGKNDDSVEIGQEYELYIDPENPQNFINPKDNNEQRGRIKFIIICYNLAAILFVAYLVTVFLTI